MCQEHYDLVVKLSNAPSEPSKKAELPNPAVRKTIAPRVTANRASGIGVGGKKKKKKKKGGKDSTMMLGDQLNDYDAVRASQGKS